MPHCHEEPGVVPEGAMSGEPPGTKPREASWRPFLVAFLVLSAVLAAASLAAYARSRAPPAYTLPPGATIYYNEACSDCAMYLHDELIPALESLGLPPVVKDYINTPAYREELRVVNDNLGIPFTLQSHFVTFVKGVNLTVLEGHVPIELSRQAIAASAQLSRLLVHPVGDAMANPTRYHAWAFDGEVKEYAVGTPVSQYVSWYGTNGGGTGPADAAILPLVLVTGFVDGLNPCAFAVLLFFVSFLYVSRRPRIELARIGSLYIYAVFLAYLLIGLGLLAAILLFEDAHLLARVAGVLVAAMGAFVLLQPYFPKIPNPFHTPGIAWERIRPWMLKGTSPGAAVAGFLVGLCTFPCSGGIYVAVLGFLAARTTFWEGLGYLYLYNLAFVLPLVLVLLVVSNKALARRATMWERAHAFGLRRWAALAMVLVGLLTAVLV